MKIVRPYALTDTGSFTRAGVGTSYNKSGAIQSNAVNVPRLSYDSVDLSKPPIFLFEPAVTNLIWWSQDFTQWANNGAVVSDVPIATAPDNATTAYSILANGTRYLSIPAGYVKVGDRCTYSLYQKPLDADSFHMYLDGMGGLTVAAYWDGTSFSVTQYGDGSWDFDVTVSIEFLAFFGWRRFSVSYNACAETANAHIIPEGAANLFWGAQLEVGSKATSYIPTAGMVITRPADVTTTMVSLLPEADAPLHDPAKLYLLGERIMVAANGVHKIFESNDGSTSPVSITLGSPGIINWAGHGLAANTPIRFTTTGALPTGMAANTVYYVKSVNADTFNLAAAVNGVAIALTGSQSGIQTATASTNYNKPPLTNPTVWLDAGSTNKWAMLDGSIESQTKNLDAVVFGFATPTIQLLDSVVLQNISEGTAARVVVMDYVEGVVYDKTVSLVDDNGIIDWHAWFTEPIELITDVAFTDLPPYAGANVSVTVAGAGSTVGVGLAVVGLSKNFGATQSGLSIGIQDYSKKEKDDFGVTTFVEGSYAHTMNMTVWVDAGRTDSVIKLLDKLRVTPCVYIGDETKRSSFLYGCYKDYSAGIDYLTVSTLHLEIESLT